MARRPPPRPEVARRVGCLAIAFVLLVVGGVIAYRWVNRSGSVSPVPGAERCVASANEASVALDLDQAYLTSIIVGLSVRRGLAPRAASIAMATVYQETGIRNLDYGDRDSVGLFQQRPSQGWGTVKQIMDPYYATGRFYDALVKIDNWESDDINDVAQKVQRSGFPEAYRDHEADARVLASAFTGHSTAGVTCLDRTDADGDARAMAASLRKTFGSLDLERSGGTVTVTARNARLAWVYAHYAVANASRYGVNRVQAGDREWTTQQITLPGWDKTDTGLTDRQVRISVR